MVVFRDIGLICFVYGLLALLEMIGMRKTIAISAFWDKYMGLLCLSFLFAIVQQIVKAERNIIDTSVWLTIITILGILQTFLFLEYLLFRGLFTISRLGRKKQEIRNLGWLKKLTQNRVVGYSVVGVVTLFMNIGSIFSAIVAWFISFY